MDAKKDRMEALVEVDNIICRLNLNLGVVKYKWDDYLYSKLPTSTLPKTVKNSEIINTILIKSWETQGSDDPIIRKKDNKSEPLMTNNCQIVNGLLMYYFKSLNIADNMKRVVGSSVDPAKPKEAVAHSFLKLGDHVIDNTFALATMEHWKNYSAEYFQYRLTDEYIDGDPADPKYGVDPKTSEIGKWQTHIEISSLEKSHFDFAIF